MKIRALIAALIVVVIGTTAGASVGIGGNVPVIINSPAAGSTLSGTVDVTATYDGTGFDVATVTVGGVQLGSDSAQPISFSIDTTRVPNGAHTLTVAVRYARANGNKRWQKASINVNVNNVVQPPPPPPPPPGDWYKVADEWQAFTLSQTSEVRFGKGEQWAYKTLGAGTHECSYHVFGDPAVGIFKECQVGGTAPPPPPPPPPPPSGLYFNGDFETGNLSQFNDFHDAHLNRVPPGFQVVARPDGGGYMARVNVQDGPDTSTYGDLAMLWEGNGGNAYSLPYLQLGQTTWFRLDFLIPNNTDSRYPGSYRPDPGAFGIMHTWHTNPGVVPTAYSTNMGPFGGGGVGNTSDPACLRLHVRGGPGEGIATGATFYQTDGAAQTQANRKPLKFNHWYSSVIKLKFGTDASTGHVEWYVDGVLQVNASVATYPSGGGGLGHEAGLYRGPTKPGLEVVYIDNMRSGPTRESVGG